MSWQSLSATLGTKPHVLAGPVLRKVTSQEATVWFALRMACTVTLEVFQGSNVILTGTRSTVAVGVNLHLVAATADKFDPQHSELFEGVVYEYDAIFDFGGLQHTLSGATDGASLAYLPYTRPSFCLPPANVNQLRLIHGSCRIPHGNGPDALSLLDKLIMQAAANPYARPHQLLMTGDQIYADDVGFAMSMMLNDAGEALLGWSEQVAIKIDSQSGRMKIADLTPAMRKSALPSNAGITSVDVRCHLIGLGEYIAMYLFVWSNVLWPSGGTGDTALPEYKDIVDYFEPKQNDIQTKYPKSIARFPSIRFSSESAINIETGRTQQFRSTLIDVRRALANIPSYMIFDDHEVTDDWNMTRAICKGMYGKDLGLQLSTNALVAYSLCQHWGNVPSQFSVTAQEPPGLRLLLLLKKANEAADVAAEYVAAAPAIRKLTGLHTEAELAARRNTGVFHDPGALTYNYTVEGVGHQVIFTDSRTWRSFPRGSTEGGDLIPAAQLERQIVDTPDTEARALLVVLTTNAPPVVPIRTATKHAGTANQFKHYPDVYEAWELPAAATDRLYKAISEKLPMVQNRRQGSALILSGDVHISFASRLFFRANTRYEDPKTKPQPVNAVYAQLVASSFRKETGDTLGFHREGYNYVPGWLSRALIWLMDGSISLGTEYYFGWNVPSGVKIVVGRRTLGGFFGEDLKAIGPKTFPIFPLLTLTPSIPVDYAYRFDYLPPSNESTISYRPNQIPPVPAGATPLERVSAIASFNKATSNYRVYNTINTTKRQVVGTNNLGEVTFDFSSGDNRSVNHTLRWFDPKTKAVMFTTYVVSLNPNDPKFPPLNGTP